MAIVRLAETLFEELLMHGDGNTAVHLLSHHGTIRISLVQKCLGFTEVHYHFYKPIIMCSGMSNLIDFSACTNVSILGRKWSQGSHGLRVRAKTGSNNYWVLSSAVPHSVTLYKFFHLFGPHLPMC